MSHSGVVARSMTDNTSMSKDLPQARDALLAFKLEGDRALETHSDSEDRLVALMGEFERPIFAFLLTLLQDHDRAQDCAQDTFLRAYRQLEKQKSVNGSWLYTVARNRAVDEFRRQRWFQPQDTELELMTVQSDVDESIVVRQVMDKLSPADREVLYLFDVVGYKTHEIASILGIRGSAVRQRLSRARERFRALYGDGE